MQKIAPQANPIFISKSAIPAIHALELGQGLLCTVEALDEMVPMMLVRLSSDQVKHFGIGPRNFPCNRNLRYLDYRDNEMIEMVLRLKWRRLLHVHMDPSAQDCRRFLSLCLETKKMVAGFYCPESPLLAATCWEWEDDEISWLHRNRIRVERLKTNNLSAVAEVCRDPKKDRHVCSIEPHDGLLISEDSKRVLFTEVINRLEQRPNSL